MTGLDFDLFYTNKVIKVVQTTTCDFLYCNRSYKLGHGNSLWSSHLTNEIQKVLRFEQTSRNDLDDLFTWRNFKTRELSLVHSHKLKTGSDRKSAKVWGVNTKKIFFFKTISCAVSWMSSKRAGNPYFMKSYEYLYGHCTSTKRFSVQSLCD